MIDYDEQWFWRVVCRRRGSVAPRALLFSLPTACFAPLLLLLEDFVPDLRESIGLEAMATSVLWSSTTACVIFLVSFRSRQALGRFWEGTGLLHQMRGEWFDAASCLMTFSRGARAAKAQEVAEFRHTLVRLMSLMHGSALEEIKASAEQAYEVIDIYGLDQQTRRYLRECKDEHGFNRVEVLLHMVQVLVTQNLDDGVLKVAPPILSRVYQTLSRGLVNLLNARKITDTKFPFPYVQLMSILLVFHALLTPVVIAELVPHKGWALLFTFVPIFGLFSLNRIAIELECPFGDDANDLPLEEFQKEMNSSLLMLLSSEADNLPHRSAAAIETVRGLTKSLTKSFHTILDRHSESSACSSDDRSSSRRASSTRVSVPGFLIGCAAKSARKRSIFDSDDDVEGEAKLRPSSEVPQALHRMEDASDLVVRQGALARATPGDFAGTKVVADSGACGPAAKHVEPLAGPSHLGPEEEERLAKWFEELNRNTEAFKLLAATLPQLARWESHSWSEIAISAEEAAAERLDGAAAPVAQTPWSVPRVKTAGAPQTQLSVVSTSVTCSDRPP